MVFAAATNSSGGSIYTVANNALGVLTPANVTNPIEFWLAFLLIAAIINTVLGKVEFFKENQNKGARVMISVVVSFFAVTVSWVNPVLVYMSSTLAITVVILIAILIVAEMAGVDKKQKNLSSYLFVAALVILFLGGGLFSHIFLPVSGGNSNGGSGVVGGTSSSALSSFFSSSDFAYAIVIIFFIGVVAWVLVGGGGGSGGDKEETFVRKRE